MDTSQCTLLKNRCATMLRNNNLKPTTKAGRMAIFMFWAGAASALSEDDPLARWIIIMLVAQRYESLLGTPEPLVPRPSNPNGN